MLAALAVLVGLWASAPWHGLGAGLVALLGALALPTPAFTDRKTRDVFRAVDVELLVYMAATMLIVRTVAGGGADRRLADAALPRGLAAQPAFMADALATLSVAAQLAIVSRRARAAVLTPGVAPPAAGLGHDAALTVPIAVIGASFRQTITASARPVAVFAAGGADAGDSFPPRDLPPLALALAPVKIALLTLFARAAAGTARPAARARPGGGCRSRDGWRGGGRRR